MERENIKYTTPIGKVEFEIISKLNAGERNQLRAIMYKNVKVGADIKAIEGDDKNFTATPHIDEISTDFVELREHTMIKVAVKKYGDQVNGEQILNILFDADADDYDYVVNVCQDQLSKTATF